ncbi:MAG: helix-turn-helix transcriptional regulator [Akkermansia sp.]
METFIKKYPIGKKMQQEKHPDGNFSSRLRAILKTKKMKQKELSSLCGLSVVAISRYISGERRPGADELFRISVALDTSMEWLIAGIKANEKTTDWQIRAERAEAQLNEVKKSIKVLLSIVASNESANFDN